MTDVPKLDIFPYTLSKKKKKRYNWYLLRRGVPISASTQGKESDRKVTKTKNNHTNKVINMRH
jgi:hypothetical protein